jgi:hypothetical protein
MIQKRKGGSYPTYVCLSCCKTYKASGGTCPCGSRDVHNVGNRFRSPGKDDKKFWAKLRVIIRGGLELSMYNYTSTLKELEERVAQRKVDRAKAYAEEMHADAYWAMRESLKPKETPKCSACGRPKDQHMGRRRGYKCLFSPTNFVEQEPEVVPCP